MNSQELISTLRNTPTRSKRKLLDEAADLIENQQNHIAALMQANDALRPRWIPVEERLPEAFVPVIVCREGAPGVRIVEQGHRDVGCWWKVYGTRTKHVTHWLPLPAGPEVE